MTTPSLSYRNAKLAQIEKLGWPFGLSVESYGVLVGLRSNQEALLSEMRSLLPPRSRLSLEPKVARLFSLYQAEAGWYVLYSNSKEIIRTASQEEALDWFEAKCRLYVAEYSPRWLFVHAGVVGWKGRALVIPGRSMFGKTTLVRALIAAGASYYSDEYAVFDEAGLLYPFATPLGMRQPGSVVQTKAPAEGLGVAIGTEPLRAGAVILTRYKKGARWAPETLSEGQAVLGLLGHTVSARRAPQRALSTLRLAVQGATAFQGDRGECEEIIKDLLR